MSLADARVEIIADLSRFRADLRDQMADIAESAGRLLEKRMNRSVDTLQKRYKDLGSTIRSELGNASRDALKGFDDAHKKSTETAKADYKSVAAAYRDNFRNGNNLVAKEFDERTARITRDARAQWKDVGKAICAELTRAAECGEKALKARMQSAAGRTKDEWRITGNVIARVLTAKPGESYDDAGLRKFVQALDGVGTRAPRAARSVKELGDAVEDAAGPGGKAAQSVEQLGERLDEAIGAGSERGQLRARRALKNVALDASEVAREAAQQAEETLRRSRGVYTDEVREAIRLSSEAGAKAAQEARAAADAAARGAGEAADQTARAANRAAVAAENSARRSAAALETSLGKSRSAFSRTLDFIDRESTRRGKNAGYNFADGFKFSVTAGIGSSVGRIIALVAAIVPFLSPIVSVLNSATGAAVALGSALGSAVVGGAIAAAAAIAAIGSAILTVKVGTSGIVEAVKQKALSDKSGVTATGQSATSTRASARAVENAQQNVASTQRAYTKSVREAADAERDARIARTKLTEAYREAKRALEDYDNAVKDAAIDERDAIAKAKDAHEALRAAYAKKGVPAAELEKLQIAADDADQKVAEAKLKNQRAQEDKATADAKGVEGSDQVVAARKAVEEADQRILDSQQAVKDAALAVANAIRDRNDAIADSADKAAGSASSATKLLDDMLAKLHPNARAAYEAIVGIQDAWKEAQKIIQGSLFKDAGPEITRMGRVYLPEVAGSMNEIATMVNTAGLSLGRFLRKSENVDRVKRIFRSNEAGVRSFSTAVNPLADLFLRLLELLTPFERKLGNLVTRLAQSADGFVSSADGADKLTRFLNGAWYAFEQLLRVTGYVFVGLGKVFGLGSTTGRGFLDSLEKSAKAFASFDQDVKKKTAVIDWFTEARETARSLKKLLGEVREVWGTLAGDTDASDFVDTLTETVHQLGRLFDQLNEGSTGKGILDTINGMLKSLADANAGASIKAFIDTLGDIIDNIVFLTGVVQKAAAAIPGGTDALHSFVVVMGTLAALKFASSIVGLGSLFGTISSGRAKVIGATNAIKTFNAARKGLPVAEAAAERAPIANLLGRGAAKTQRGGKAALGTLFPGPPLERIQKSAKAAESVDAGKVTTAGRGMGRAAATGAASAGDDVARAGAGLGARLAAGLKSKTKAVADAAKGIGSKAAERIKAVRATGDRGAASVDLFTGKKGAAKLEELGVARAAKKAEKAAKVADVAVKAEKTAAKASRIGTAAKTAGRVAGKVGKGAAGTLGALLGFDSGCIPMCADVGDKVGKKVAEAVDAPGKAGKAGKAAEEAKTAKKAAATAKAAKAAGSTAATVGAAANVAGGAADVAGAAGKGGALAKVGAAAKGAVGSVGSLTAALAANTAGVVANGLAWARNAVSIVATKVAMVATRAATAAYTAVQWLLNAAMYANPIGLVVLAIVALVAIFVIAYKKSETFRNIINALGHALLGIGKAIWGGLKAAFGYVTRFYSYMFNFWTTLPGKIVGWISEKLGKMKEIGSKLISSFMDGVSNFAGKVEDFGKNIANGAIDILNKGLDILNAGLDKIPRVLTLGKKLEIPDIPRFEWGGIVEHRMLAELGEAGREVVIPLTKPARARELAEQSGLLAMLQLKDLLPAQRTGDEPVVAAANTTSVDRSVHVENLHVHHNGTDTARATEKALRRVARLAMS